MGQKTNPNAFRLSAKKIGLIHLFIHNLIIKKL